MKTKTQEIFELSCPYGHSSQGHHPKYLFVCSAGLLRSPTFAKVLTEIGYNTRSCGSESYALIPLSVNLIFWADKIFFMEEFNYEGALATFSKDEDTLQEIKSKHIILGIEDKYDYNCPTLVSKAIELFT